MKKKLLAISELLSLAANLEEGAYSTLFSAAASDLVEIVNQLSKEVSK